MNFSKINNSALDIVKKRKIELLLQDPNNNECFECNKLFPDYISINNAIFLCNDCAKIHLNFPKSLSNIIRNSIDNLSIKNVQYLTYGGNKNLKIFINNEYPNLTKLSPIYFYQTHAMDYYRKRIQYLVEGGIKPIKPDNNLAYELISINQNIDNKIIQRLDNYQRKQKLIKKIKSESFIKRRNNPYPKIKPLVGISRESKYNKFIVNNNKNYNSFMKTSTNFKNYGYFNDSMDGNTMKLRSSSTEKKNTYYPSFHNNYDVDDDYFNPKELYTQLDNNNNSLYKKDSISGYNNSNTIQNKNIKLREKILKRNENYKHFKNFYSNPCIKNYAINNNNIYAQYMSQNYLSNYKNINDNNLYSRDKSYNNERNNNTTIFNYDRRRNVNSNIDLRSYLQDNSRDNENYIFNLKLNSSKPTLINGLNEEEVRDIKKNSNINNINNNIIINRNLNVFYNNNTNNNNNNEQKKIFKKKPLGNSFSIQEKRHSIQNSMTSLEYLNYLKDNTKCNNTLKNIKIIFNERNDKNLIKVNKMKTSYKTEQGIKTYSDLTNFVNKYGENKNIIVNRNLKNKNNNKEKNIKEEKSEESEIIKRISRVIKIQKEKKEKKNYENINNKTTDSNKIPNNYKFKIINVTKINHKIKENKTNKEKENITNKNTSNPNLNKNVKEIKIKIYKRNSKTIKNIEPRKTNHSLMKELNNLPSGKKKNILEIIKSNILSNNSVSPGVQKILNIRDEQNIGNNSKFK